jgi:hypothetical protein
MKTSRHPARPAARLRAQRRQQQQEVDAAAGRRKV